MLVVLRVELLLALLLLDDRLEPSSSDPATVTALAVPLLRLLELLDRLLVAIAKE